MVDEFLSEREQADQMRQWLRENWIWLAAGVALALGGFYGWRAWESRESSRSLEAGQRFAAMLEALSGDRRDEGVRIGTEVTGEYADTPYADQAELVLARVEIESGDLAAAERRLARVAQDARDSDLRLVARLRQARVQLAQGRYAEALATLDAVSEPSVRARVLELRGDVKLAQGETAAALEAWREARAEASGPAGQQLIDTELLQLKIDEQGAAGAAE